jgi:hypothetical protein
MIALLLLGYFAVGITLAIFIPKVIPKGRWRITVIVFGLIAVIWLPFWPHFGGKQLFEYRCEHYGGERIYKKVKTEGYLNSRYHPKGSNSMLHGVFRQAVSDLVNRHILFFETKLPNRTGYYRFSLESKGHQNCLWYYQWYKFQRMLEREGLESTQCLARSKINELNSEFEVRTTSHHFTSRAARTWVESRKSGETIAEYNSYILYDPLNFVSGRAGVCPQPIDSDSIMALPEKVFDKWRPKIINKALNSGAR